MAVFTCVCCGRVIIPVINIMLKLMCSTVKPISVVFYVLVKRKDFFNYIAFCKSSCASYLFKFYINDLANKQDLKYGDVKGKCIPEYTESGASHCLVPHF